MKFKRILKLLLSFLPSKLPLGMTEYEAWAQDIIAISGLPDNDSVRFGLAAALIHAKEQRGYLPKIHFARVLHKGASNQVAGEVMQILKEKDQAARLAAQKAQLEAVAKQAEAPAEPQVADGQSGVKKLQDTWNKKLKKSGFKDIEEPDDDRLKRWDSHYFHAHYSSEEYASKEEYYRLAGLFLHQYTFENEKEKLI